MTRTLPLIVAVSFGLLLLSLGHPKVATAQALGTDTIRFLATTRGANFDGQGFAWCWVYRTDTGTGWHGFWNNALDEVPQTSPYSSSADFPTYCPSQGDQQVDFQVRGQTDNPNCTLTNPCISLLVQGRSGAYADGCHYVEADLFDYLTYATYSLQGSAQTTGDWKGKPRMLHALGLSSWSNSLAVAQNGWYRQDIPSVGTVQNDINCTSVNPLTWNYHVHQDFMPPTTGESCLLSKNTNIAPAGSVPPPNPSTAGLPIQTNAAGSPPGWRTENPDHWIHSLVHKYGTACVTLGQAVATILLGSGGVLDDTGQGTYDLASGAATSKTTPVLNLPGTNWHGTITVTPDILIAARWNFLGGRPRDYFLAKQQVIPRSGNQAHFFWYGPDAQGYYLQMWWYVDANPPNGHCYANPGYQSLYWVDIYSSAGGQCNQQVWYGLPSPMCYGCYSYGFSTDMGAGIQTVWSQYRGAGGFNPSNPPTLADAKAWVLSLRQNWPTLRPYVLNAITGIQNRRDAATEGITGSPNFECRDLYPPVDTNCVGP